MRNSHTYDSILSVISDYVTSELDVNIKKVEPTHRLQEDLGLESIGMLSLAVEIENYFQIYLSEGENPPITIDDVVKLILLRLSEQSDAAS